MSGTRSVEVTLPAKASDRLEAAGDPEVLLREGAMPPSGGS